MFLQLHEMIPTVLSNRKKHSKMFFTRFQLLGGPEN